MQTPFLMVTGVHDKQVAPERVRDLYADLGSKQKVLIDLACSSHNAMWEMNHLLLFQVSLEWLNPIAAQLKPRATLPNGETSPVPASRASLDFMCLASTSRAKHTIAASPVNLRFEEVRGPALGTSADANTIRFGADGS
jgi:hypothetical protein